MTFLGEITKRIKDKKGWKVFFGRIVHEGFYSEFVCCQKKVFIFYHTILWIDIDKIEKKEVLFFTRNKEVAEIVKKVGTLYEIKCREVERDYFPPSLAF